VSIGPTRNIRFLEASQISSIVISERTISDEERANEKERERDRPAAACRQADDKQTILVGSLLLFDAPSLINSSKLSDPWCPPIISRHD